ncbi:MAG: CcmE/CycJ protein [Burkholderiales bacterium]|nr:CcmE/CycJ protein [Burkholderiales bacterium]
MTRKRRRLYILLLFMVGLGSAAALTLAAFRDNLVFFYSPSEVAEKDAPRERNMRLGGLVERGSVERVPGTTEVRFRVTDLQHTIAVVYAGALPDLFREGQGVVAQGQLGADGVFRAREVLAKHDENYMPPDAAHAVEQAQKTLQTK